ncbi:nuclear transport factor 2 family protein [Pseudomonas putida]|uniref:SnoaL-like domain-containing protein n=1 Tax=Pseudomonas putida TaxID=303 RepID=A0A1Q9R612_PSEPU|nr:nuclear transport factor 2 family protein [Pseudomonas putida]OLS62854.1 hypothetical protein PSEMO_22080 [Pseudomonas putida]
MNTSNDGFDWSQAQAVLDTLHRYGWGYDSFDMELMGAAFAEDATTGGVVSNSTSGWGPWTGRAAIVAGLSAIHASQPDRRRHVITTPMFLSLTPEQAELKALLTCYSILPGAQPVLATTGEYHARLSRTNGNWAIDRLDAVLDGEF